MFVKKIDDIVNWTRKHYIAFSGKLALEEDMDLSLATWQND